MEVVDTDPQPLSFPTVERSLFEFADGPSCPKSSSTTGSSPGACLYVPTGHGILIQVSQRLPVPRGILRGWGWMGRITKQSTHMRHLLGGALSAGIPPGCRSSCLRQQL